jgi:hypothetical protein
MRRRRFKINKFKIIFISNSKNKYENINYLNLFLKFISSFFEFENGV